MPEKTRSKEEITDFLNEALERFKTAADAEMSIRTESLQRIKFYNGEQWEPDVVTIRRRRGRPSLVMNHLPQFKRQITNEQRQQKPSISVNPIGDDSDVETAEILQGMVRHIEVRSNADVARDTAFEQMVVGDFGYYRLLTEYINGKDGPQEIRQQRIKNPFTVYYDPNCMEADYSDAEWAFVIEDLRTKLFKRKYPNTEAASLSEYGSIGDTAPGWMNEESIRIADYFYITGEGDQRKCHWAKITALDILEEQDWAGRYIPIIPVLGEELYIDGKRTLKGMVADGISPQRQYNYMHSGAAEAIALLPKVQRIGYAGQFEDFEQKWEKANQEALPYLEVNAKTTATGDQILPIPQLMQAQADIGGYVQMISLADNDLKAAIGIYDASLGQKGPEQSGKAIAQRKQQGDIATLNYSDNLARSILFEGRQLIDLIPKIYDTPRVQRIIKPDGSVSQVIIHTGQEAAAEKLKTEQVSKIYNIGVGDYDVAVQVGPSYQSKRQEAVATQMEIIKADPQLMGIIGDLLVGEMDIPGAKEIAKRLHAMLPPQVLQADDPQKQGQELQAQNQQLQAQNQQIGSLLQQAHQIIQTKQVEQQGKKDIAAMQEQSKIAVTKMQELTKLAVAQINASKDLHQTFAEGEIEQYGLAHDSAHEVAMTGIQQDHEKQMAQLAAQNAQQSQQSDQTHELGMSVANAQPANGNGQ